MIYKVIVLLVAVAVTSGIYVARGECGRNEEYLLCGSACPFNCTDPEEPVNCLEDCVEGCFCKSGYLRNENGTCVTSDQCLGAGNKSVCAANEEFLSCGTVCPGTCSNPEPECGVAACSMGCFCKSGFVRDEVQNKCVVLDNCTAEQCFNQNEVYDMCSALCEPTCEDPEPICTKSCDGGCVCASGLLRDGSGTCVSVDKCPPTNSTAGPLRKYLNEINKILHLTLA